MEININNLSKEVYEITQNCGTEPPFSGKLLNEKRKGKPSIGTLNQTIAVPIPASHRILESGASSE